MLFLVCLSVVAMLTEACEKPICSLQNSVDAKCKVEIIDVNDIETRLCSDGVKINQHSVTRTLLQNSKKYINGTFAIHVTMGKTRRKYRALIMEVKQKDIKMRYFVRIQERKDMVRGSIQVNLSCLTISKQSTDNSILVGIAGELDHGKKKKCKPKYRKFRQIHVREDFPQNERSTISSNPQNPSKDINLNRLKRSKWKKIKDENCIVDSENKTVTHYWKKPVNVTIEKCGILNANGIMTNGEWNEKGGMIYCITKYTIPDNYYSRIYYKHKHSGMRHSATPCHFAKEILEHNNMMDLRSTKHSWINSSDSFVYSPTTPDPSVTPEVAALSERHDNYSDDTLLIILLLLLFGVVLLLFVIAALLRGRKKLHRIPEPYPHERRNISESCEPTVMIITVDEYSRDISQLTSLLQSQKIKIVTAESSSQENIRSRHDWLEKTVSNSNHYIFIVNKQMREIFKTKFNKPLEEKPEITSSWSTEYEGGTCAYTIVLIRNEFIKSLMNPGSSLKSCHLVSFEEDDETVVSQLKHEFNLFQCIKTNCYNLYSNKQFRYNAACRIINNIKKTEKWRDCKTTHQISSGNHTHTVHDLDVESAFLSMNISSNHCYIPQSNTDDTDSGSDIEVTSDLLGTESRMI